MNTTGAICPKCGDPISYCRALAACSYPFMRRDEQRRLSWAQKRAAMRTSSCAACAADAGDIGAFDRGIEHTFRSDCYSLR